LGIILNADLADGTDFRIYSDLESVQETICFIWPIRQIRVKKL